MAADQKKPGKSSKPSGRAAKAPPKGRPAQPTAATTGPSAEAPSPQPMPAAAPSNGSGALVAAPPVDVALGQATWLLMNMPAFRHIFIADLEWFVLPPILLGQFRILYEKRRAVALATWGLLSPEAEKRLGEPNPRLAPADWKSGDRLWLVSVIAPFGHTDAMLKDLRMTALAGKSFKMHRVGPDGKKHVVEVGAAAGAAPVVGP